MATVIVHDVDDGALDRLRSALAMTGGSVEEEIRAMIAQRAGLEEVERRQRAEEAIAGLRAYREGLRDKYGTFPDSVDWLRQDRDSW